MKKATQTYTYETPIDSTGSIPISNVNNMENNSVGGTGSYRPNTDSEFPRAVPGDLELLRPWFDLVRHTRSKSCSGGLSIVNMALIVDQHGMPLFWTEPTVKKISPLARDEATRAILAGLAGDK